MLAFFYRYRSTRDDVILKGDESKENDSRAENYKKRTTNKIRWQKKISMAILFVLDSDSVSEYKQGLYGEPRLYIVRDCEPGPHVFTARTRAKFHRISSTREGLSGSPIHKVDKLISLRSSTCDPSDKLPSPCSNFFLFEPRGGPRSKQSHIQNSLGSETKLDLRSSTPHFL